MQNNMTDGAPVLKLNGEIMPKVSKALQLKKIGKNSYKQMSVKLKRLESKDSASEAEDDK